MTPEHWAYGPRLFQCVGSGLGQRKWRRVDVVGPFGGDGAALRDGGERGDSAPQVWLCEGNVISESGTSKETPIHDGAVGYVWVQGGNPKGKHGYQRS